MTNRTGGQFPPGQSGNPSGRPKGASKTTQARALLLDAVPDAVATLRAAAGKGDVKASVELLRLALPPLKPVDAPLPVEFDGSQKPTERVRVVLESLAAAELSPEQAESLLAVLGGMGKAMDEARSQEMFSRSLGLVRRSP